MSESKSVLSRAMLELWGLAEDGRRGPKPTMSVRRIAAAGVELADAEGLAAVTMSAVAKSLGFTAMSLYRYVESRDDLIAAMVDEAMGPPPEPQPRRAWRRRLEDWAHAEAARLHAHPWVIDVRTPTPPVGPNMVGWTESGFACLAGSGLPPQVTASALLTIDGIVRSSVQLARQYGGPEAETWADQLRVVTTEASHPAMTAVLVSGAFEDASEDTGEFGNDELDFAIGLVLDGLERLL